MPQNIDRDTIHRIVDLAPCLIYIFDVREGKNIFSNYHAFEHYGYKPEDLNLPQGELFQRLFHPDDQPIIHANFARMKDLKADQKLRLEYRLKTKLGNWVWVQDEAVVFKADENGAILILGFVTNINTYKATQKELEATLDRLNHSQMQLTNSAKMAALGEMSAGIAHEINNPLTVIQARAFQLQQLSELEKLDKDKVFQISDSISKTADKIAKIVKGLRSYARDGSNDPKDLLSLRLIVDETLEFCRTRFNGQGVDIVLDNLPEEIEVECRVIQLEQVLLNLLNNAFDAIIQLEKKWVRIEATENDQYVELSITDSGSGIPAEIAEKMMMPFFTTKEVNKGTGLGLSISEGIIRAHGGELLYDSTSSNTRFVIRLPKSQQP